jgi:DNA-binding MarR family transcriptional regulator
MSDLEFHDTPALEVLRRLPEPPGHIAPADIAAAQHLLRVAKRILGSFAEQFALHGLSPGRYALLMALYVADRPLAPSEIADRLGVTRATVTGLIAGLVRDGLVDCAPADSDDRRRKATALSASGRNLLGDVAQDVFIQMAALTAMLTGEERSLLLGLLSKIEAGLSRGAE